MESSEAGRIAANAESPVGESLLSVQGALGKRRRRRCVAGERQVGPVYTARKDANAFVGDLERPAGHLTSARRSDHLLDREPLTYRPSGDHCGARSGGKLAQPLVGQEPGHPGSLPARICWEAEDASAYGDLVIRRDLPPGASFPAALEDVATRVEERVLGLLDAEAVRWARVDSDLAAPLGALRDLVTAGGKRLRPAFCHCGFLAAGGMAGTDEIIDAGAALELVHTFALVHDDVMDGSDARRGAASVHRAFADMHGARGWRGESRRFGEGMAILVGDFALTYADVLARGLAPDARCVYDELRVELCVGQSLDLTGTARRLTDSATARRIATYKSGKYTVERPLHLGAAIAGGLDSLGGALSDIGLPLGEAFQLRDDVLGVFGDEVATGKPVGDDLREGKLTPLVAIATKRAVGSERSLLARLGAADLDTDEIKAMQDLFVSSGTLREVELAIDRLVAEAQTAIACAPMPDAARVLLDGLAEYVARRDR